MVLGGGERKPDLEELGGSLEGLAGGDLDEGGDQGLLLRSRRGIACHGGESRLDTIFFFRSPAGGLVSRVRGAWVLGWVGLGSKEKRSGRKRAGDEDDESTTNG
jgi:hypothetical protein